MGAARVGVAALAARDLAHWAAPSGPDRCAAPAGYRPRVDPPPAPAHAGHFGANGTRRRPQSGRYLRPTQVALTPVRAARVGREPVLATRALARSFGRARGNH